MVEKKASGAVQTRHVENSSIPMSESQRGGLFFPQKAVNHYWGSIDVFMKATDPAPSFKGAHILVEKWTDREGNIWYQLYWRDSSGFALYFEIDRISQKGRVLEFCFDSADFPTENDVKSKNVGKKYRIFYRQ